jgi:transcriptional regulator with XRE-family HTH domain
MKLDKKRAERERIRLGISKAEVSRRLELGDSAYGKIIKNESTTFKTLTRLSIIFHVDPLDLLLR